MNGEVGSNDGAGADAGNGVNGDVVFLEDLDHADLRDAFGTAGAKGEADARFFASARLGACSFCFFRFHACSRLGCVVLVVAVLFVVKRERYVV